MNHSITHISKAAAQVLLGAWLILTSCAEPAPQIQLLQSPSLGIAIEWQDPDLKWALERSSDAKAWAIIDTSAISSLGDSRFKFSEPLSQAASFYRLREASSSMLYVVGDSISALTTWATTIGQITNRRVSTQAVGGSTSPSMVNRARGVQLLRPKPSDSPISNGPVRICWVRHAVDRSQWRPFHTDWTHCPKTVSEPRQIEVYSAGKFLGLATHDTTKFATDHQNHPKTIFCPGHGFQSNDRVTFLSNDPVYPHELLTTDSSTKWNFSSPHLPPSIIERRVYWAANVTTDTLELKELSDDSTTIDLGGNATGNPVIEKGWYFDLMHQGGSLNITWISRTKFDDRIWLLEVSANDFPVYSASNITIPNTMALLSQINGPSPRYLIICPPLSSNPERGPGSFSFTNYYNIYIPWVTSNHPNNHINTMNLMNSERTIKELSFLADQEIPQLLWIRGSPESESSWQASSQEFSGASRMWIGPGFIPLQFRAAFSDGIHLGPMGNHFLATTVASKLDSKGW